MYCPNCGNKNTEVQAGVNGSDFLECNTCGMAFNVFEDENKTIKLTEIQKEELKKPCPNCKKGRLRPVQGVENEEGEITENYLWCNNCDLSIDGSGGYTH